MKSIDPQVSTERHVRPRKALVVPHTHWDRAWYWPYERFRGKLMELWEILLGEFNRVPGYCYSTDGQTAMVEDFLSARPECREQVAVAARSGALSIGPWYVQPDSFLTGAEAQIRNIMLGVEFARNLGGDACVCRALHLPDTFGITIETPALAAGLGFKVFTFMRGHSDEIPALTSMIAGSGTSIPAPPRECRMFWWQSPDGSRIRVFRLRDGYANLRHVGRFRKPGTPAPDLDKEIEALLETARRQDDAQGEPLLLLAGSDHAFPPTGLPQVLGPANARGEYLFQWATLTDLADKVSAVQAQDWFVHHGEFHGSGAASVLGGTISSRIYLKQANTAMERLLTHGVEPLQAAAALLGFPDPASALVKTTWKTLLQNHQHDSICGCSVDSVHRMDEANNTSAREAADGLRRRGFNRLFEAYGVNRIGDNRFSLALFNPQGTSVHGLSRHVCDFEGLRSWGDLRSPSCYRLVDEAGHPVPFREAARGKSVEHPHDYVTLDLCPEMQGGSFARFYLEETPVWPGTVSQTPNTLENEFLKATVCGDGSVSWLDKVSGRQWDGLGYFSAQPDIGDEYDFADDPAMPEIVMKAVEWEVRDGGGCSGLQVVIATALLDTPGAGRLPIRVEWLLAEGWHHVDVRIQFTNQTPGWRLRWNLALPSRPVHSRAGLKFQEMVRPITDPPLAGPAPRIYPEHPADHFVATEAADGSGVAIYSEFPMNYEVCLGQGCRLAVTVLRAVGWLCNPEPLTTRPGNHAGPHTATPDAQCLGRALDLRFALRVFGAGEAGGLFLEAANWRTPPVGGQCDATMSHPDRPANAAPVNPAPLYRIEGDTLFTQAMKRPHDITREGVILRFARMAPREGEAVLTFAFPVEVRDVNLAEEDIDPPGPLEKVDDCSIRFTVGGWALRTLRVRRVK